MEWIVFSFKINQDYITKNFCINRNKPEKKCNGKCFLAKKIKESKENRPLQAPVSRPDEQKQVYNIQDAVHLSVFIATTTTARSRFAQLIFTTQSCVIEVFHPPKPFFPSCFLNSVPFSLLA